MTEGDRGLRLILATLAVDRWHARLDRLRSTLILAFASDAALDRFNEWAYSRAETYRPGSEGFRRHLYPWEEHVIGAFFPPPPARLILGGAGAGRESLALAKAGYEIIAFEPVRALAEAMARQVEVEGNAARIQVLRGGYEDLPHLRGISGASQVAVDDLGPFDAAILGWGSFSHLRSVSHRINTLRTFARLTAGPVLVSFIAVKSPRRPGSGHGIGLRRLLGRRGRDPEDRFSIHMGYQHPVSEEEIASLAGRAGLEVVELQFAGGETYAPYAVLRRVRSASVGQAGRATRPRGD
jgi:hypothetical protein